MAECVICLESLPANFNRTTCDHLFHEQCIERWLSQHTTCPVCRASIPSRSKDISIVFSIFLLLIMFFLFCYVERTELCEDYYKSPGLPQLNLNECNVTIRFSLFFNTFLNIGNDIMKPLDFRYYLCK